MTVQQIVPYVKYVTNGADSVYTVNFFIEDKENLFIKLNDVVVSMNDYNYLKDVNGIEFHTPLLANQKLEIFRKTKLERTTNFESFNNTFRPEVLNKDLDKIWLNLQEQSHKVDQYDLDYTYSVSTANQALKEVKDAQARADDAYELADLTNTEIRPIPRGGTGANNASDARNNLNTYSKEEVNALIATGGEGNVVGVAGGGTGAVNKVDARNNLEVFSKAETEEKINELVPSAGEVKAGKAKIATTAIAKAGADDTDIITAKKLRDALNAGGNAPVSACRAWVVFNATSGGVTILNSLNVSSVVRTATGKYTVNFATPLPTANYALMGFCSRSATNSTNSVALDASITTTLTSVGIMVNNGASTIDLDYVSFGVFC